jgi:hypothetical protein
MSDPLQVQAGSLSADEVLAALQEGRRVLIETQMLGSTHEVSLRYDGEVFYCDTPTTLHKHESVDGMRTCLEEQGYAE